MIRLARPWIGAEELDGVREVLESGMLVMGARVAAFEARLAEVCERRHAIAVGSGTAALELALEALDVRSHRVLCPALSWPSPAHAIVRSGAVPVLYDVDPASWNGTPEGAAAARTPLVRAAIVIDQFGMPAPHPPSDVPTIVDAACSIGSTVDGRPAPARGTIACLSFHPRKLLTTGEGGACLTDDDALADALRALRNHGQRDGGFVVAAGNQRMTEMAAAMGLAQLDRLDAIVARRRELADRYRDALPDARVQRPARDGVESNWQTFGVIVDDRDALVAALREDGVEAGRLSFAMNRIGSLAGRFEAGSPDFAVAESLEDGGLALPLHPLMSDADQARVIERFRRHTGS
ncbi:MAG: DegT/DnrJ/EryC1/StrS family aminotransferase [Sandaracinaceae bacterium]|nr:DegT/DnrJ/EryC1/StrS family aminotransferase [Sandaracinaceae bacterium]